MDTHLGPTADARSADARSVDGEFFYVARTDQRLRTYTYDPPPGVPRNNAVQEAHRLKVRDARPLASELSLDREGFALVRQASAMRDFTDEDALGRLYYPESAAIVAAATGAERVVVFDHTIRRRIHGVEDRGAGTPRQPVGRVHNDYTEKSGPRRVRDLMGAETEALLLKCFDSARDGRARMAPHSAFEDPTAPPDRLPRESIEIRTLVFHAG